MNNILSLALGALGYEIRRIGLDLPLVAPSIPDGELYRPLFSPWLGGGEFKTYYDLAAPRTHVSPDRCYVLYRLLLQALEVEGNIWECGVYTGGTASMMSALIRDKMPAKKLYLFDTFEGMPQTDAGKDWHSKGDFSDTSQAAVERFLGAPEQCVFRKGTMPATFAGLESAHIALAHIDVDLYRSVKDCLDFVWPRLSRDGFIVCDDYGFPTCPGARTAVDEFFEGKTAYPLCLPTGQALIFKGED